MVLVASLVAIALAAYALWREADVRLVLFVAGFVLAALGGAPLAVFDTFLAEAGNGKTIGPICSAMGFAFVLRATGCDKEMIKLLMKPVTRVPWLLIPGGCAVGFITNIAITSQTATAAAVGPILIPLMLAAGYSPPTAGATLLLGCSGGGSLYNPGDADLVAIHDASGAPMADVLQTIFMPLLGGFIAAVILLMTFSRRTAPAAESSPPEPAGPIHLGKALLPPLPVLLIFMMLPGGPLPALPAPYDKGLPVSHAMLIGVIAVLLVHRRELSQQTRQFFEGMGYAYVHIISIIVTASCFIAGLTQTGLTDRFVSVVSGAGVAGKVAAGVLPGILAIVSGSGIGPSVAFSKAVLPTLQHDLPLALDLGVLAAIASTFGRTMSPVAAVVIFCGTLAGISPWQLIKQTAPVLIGGFVIVLSIVLLRGH